MATVLLLGGLFAYPIWEIIHSTNLQETCLAKYGFDKICNRSYMLVAFAGIWPLLKANKLGRLEDFGLNCSKAEFRKNVWRGFIFGFCTLIIIAFALYFLEIRTSKAKNGDGLYRILHGLTRGILSGLIIGFLEEVFFRGILTRTFARQWGKFSTITCTSLLYASVHFVRAPKNFELVEVQWYSGIIYLKDALHLFTDPAFIGSFLTLFVVGVFLSALMLHSGNIALSVGVHAGWVCVLMTAKKTTRDNIKSDLRWLVGNYDEFTGYLAFAWLLVICFVSWKFINHLAPQKIDAENNSTS